MPVMAGPTKREIRDQDVQGLKCLRKIRPLLSRLRKVGTERDRAGRRLFMDQSCALILMSLFSPAIESLRDLQRACTLDKVRKRLGVSRGWKGPHCDGVLRLVTNRLDLPAELIAEIQAYCAMIVCMLILIYTGEKPNRAMYQMVWYYLVGLASLKELEAFIRTRR